MSEILEMKPENIKNVENGGAAGWDSVGEVDFAGDKMETKKKAGEIAGENGNAGVGGEVVENDEAVGEGSESIEGKVARLRGWIDLEAIAGAEDPEGLAAVEQESAVRAGRIEECKVLLAEGDGKYKRNEERMAALSGEMAAAKGKLREFEWKEKRGLLSGVKRAMGIGTKRRAELTEAAEELEAERQELYQEQLKIEDERRELEERIAGTDVEEPKQEFLEKFETPLMPEEKKEGLDFEALAELSTEEYLELWRRLNPFFLTHVTRQGIRDHNAMVYHSAGMGEFQEGMTEILADGKMLRTPAEVHYGLGQEVTEEGVAGALDKMLAGKRIDIEEMRGKGMSDKAIVNSIVEGLPVNSTIAAAEPWTDKQAVHFAQMTALDEYYGGETGNEAMFVFPTDVIASQCRFGGHTRDGLTTAQVDQERKWNDMFVWPEGKEITIDAGLTFLPKSTMVDLETGSKYATEVVEHDGHEVRVPIIDEEAVGKFAEWVSNLDEAAGENYDEDTLMEQGKAAGVPERMLREVLDPLEDFQYRLPEFLKGGDLSKDMWLIPPEELEKMTPEERRRRSVEQYLEGYTSRYKLAEDAIPAEEYWEGYFREHPEQKPAHIIYYDGDPSEAILGTLKTAGVLEETRQPYGNVYDEWQRVTGRGDSHERDGDWLGFEENHVKDPGEDEKMQGEHDKFNEIARKLVAEHYGLAA